MSFVSVGMAVISQGMLFQMICQLQLHNIRHTSQQLITGQNLLLSYELPLMNYHDMTSY